MKFIDSWPTHCVAGTEGADFHTQLGTEDIERVFDKGAFAAAYSGFEGADADGVPLAAWLRDHGIDSLDIVGVYPNYATAHVAWKAKAQQTVDNAQTRYFIVHLHRLMDPEATSPDSGH